MKRATPQMRVWSQCLIAFETGEDHSSEIVPPSAFHALEKLRPHLVRLMGTSGYRALKARALVLAQGEVRALEVLQVNPSGVVEGLEAFDARFSHEVKTEAGIVLLARLLGLLVTFIGQALTAQVIHEVWPELAPMNRGFDTGDEE
jgi:hypothetical protein